MAKFPVYIKGNVYHTLIMAIAAPNSVIAQHISHTAGENKQNRYPGPSVCV